MKRILSLVMVIATVMSMLFILPASPAAAASERSITLAGVDFVAGKGFVFLFLVKGNFKSYEGYLKLGNNFYNLNCNLNDNGLLACIAPKGIRQFIGKAFSGQMNGFSFSGIVPPTLYCYAIFDVDSIPPHPWEQVGTYCQEDNAEVGDIIEWYNPEWSGTYDYIYSLDGSDSTAFPPNLGNGYYWTY